MARPSIEPITSDTLPEVASFLNTHLDSGRSVQAWIQGLTPDWSESPPNHGFSLRASGRIVGAICAIYARRTIRGDIHHFCNITSWCVLDEFRKDSMRLAMSVLSQSGYTFTDFSPTQVVAGTLSFLKFQPIREQQTVILNTPHPLASGSVAVRAEEIETRLSGQDLEDFRIHRRYPWLMHVALGREGRWAYVVYKRGTFKGLPSARIIHVSDAEVLDQYLARLCHHLLLTGTPSTHIESRKLKRAPRLSRTRSGFNARLFRSETLSENDIDYLYSETVVLDL